MAVGNVDIFHICDVYIMANPLTYIYWIHSNCSHIMDWKSKKEYEYSMKRTFGIIEIIFDVLYLFTAMLIGILLILSATENTIRLMAGIMAIVLSGGDAFHLIPRILLITRAKVDGFHSMLGRGKQIASITMTIFYILLWHIGISVYGISNLEFWTFLLYILAIIRIFLCFLPQNKWSDHYPPVLWGIYRNIPFLFMGMIVGVMFFMYRSIPSGFELAWLALSLSFIFYLPVVLWVNFNPKIGMLMIPKTLTYLWLLIMCLSI